MNRLGRFEKIIFVFLLLVAGLAAFIFFTRGKQRQLSFERENARPEDILRQQRAAVSDNVDAEKTFAYDEAGLKTQSAQSDYLAKAKNSQTEQGTGENAASSSGAVAGSKTYNLASEDDPAWGNKNSKVTIVSFSDFLCPFCAEFSRKVMPQIKSYYSNKVYFIFRDLPIEALHPGTTKAHEAGECANEQGLFWPMHDLIFANNASLTAEKLKSLAQAAGLDLNKFTTCLDSGKKNLEVMDDLEEGLGAGVRATPTLFINGRKVEGLVSFNEISKMIEEELK